jgi:tRNA (mo5U34)-methyltransferase
VEAEEIQRQIDHVPVWFHSIDLGAGIVTPGLKSASQLDHELRNMRLPDCQGLSVLDIGAWDGYFSFEAERRGARRVVALDHYVWSMDVQLQSYYAAKCHALGAIPTEQTRVPGVWNPGALPGKRGFDTAHRILDSSVEQVVADFQSIPTEEIGAFDVVFFLGVLYHLPNPLLALKKLAVLTRRVAIIETAAILIPGLEHKALYEFYGQNELNNDPSNWWAPNPKALCDSLLAAGFRRAEIVAGKTLEPKSLETGIASEIHRNRIVAHAYV